METKGVNSVDCMACLGDVGHEPKVPKSAMSGWHVNKDSALHDENVAVDPTTGIIHKVEWLFLMEVHTLCGECLHTERGDTKMRRCLDCDAIGPIDGRDWRRVEFPGKITHAVTGSDTASTRTTACGLRFLSVLVPRR